MQKACEMSVRKLEDYATLDRAEDWRWSSLWRDFKDETVDESACVIASCILAEVLKP
jgi:hypothetical protein